MTTLAVVLLGNIALPVVALEQDDPSPTPTVTTEQPTPEPSIPEKTTDATMNDKLASAYGRTGKDLSSSGTGAVDPGSPGSTVESSHQPKIKNSPAKADVDVRVEGCTDMSLQQCVAGRTACMTMSGGPAGFKPPMITWVSVDDAGWEYRGLSCGPPESVTLPDGDTVQVDAPPVPTLGDIQEAFRSLPFSKPTASIQPVGLKTLVNLPTYYQATWPDDTGLQPGETSDPVQLLSWTVEFKITAKEYRYNYGDDTTGTVPGSIDARLTGQYRVNGGPWQDIATTADLQDEPTSDLQALGTDTKLVAE